MNDGTFELMKNIKEGKYWEKVLDRHFRNRYDIHEVPLHVDKAGVDRIWTDKQQEELPIAVQYKSDSEVEYYNNAFIEVDVRHYNSNGEISPSWPFTSKAEIHCHFFPPFQVVCLVNMMHLKSLIPTFSRYDLSGWVPSSNDGKTWFNRGRKIPVDIFYREFCFDVQEVEFTEEDVRHLEAQRKQIS